MKNVLVVEDNLDIANLVSIHLRDIGAKVDIVHDGLSGFNQAQNTPYDLIILDLMLPQMDGIEVCRNLRAQDNPVPILMLTAKSTELDRVLGLEIGADDYLTKPFSVRELVARAKAIFRRMDSIKHDDKPVSSNLLQFDQLSLNATNRTISLAGKALELTAKEFDLLWHFASHPGQVFSRTQLLDSVWGYGHDGYEHTVNSHINRLRAKIEQDPSQPHYVLTVWGVGYKFSDQLNSH